MTTNPPTKHPPTDKLSTDNRPTSSYLDYLPALYADNEFLGRFLLAFEQILSGPPGNPLPSRANNGTEQLSLEQLIEQLYTYFRPLASPQANTPTQNIAPAAFLPWLATWVALQLQADWDEATQRQLIHQMVSLYRWRGTKKGLKTLLKLYTQEDVEIYEFDRPPHYFQVELALSDLGRLGSLEAMLRTLIDREKPAQTFYTLQLLFPTMRIINQPKPERPGLRLGVNTLLGTVNQNRRLRNNPTSTAAV